MATDKEIMNKIAMCYIHLSPENLWQDGEATASQANATAKRIYADLKELFKQLGRIVTEEEAYASIRR
jgi:hypothetical protein